MSHLKLPVLILTLLALAACSSIPASPLELNRQKWQNQNITHYRFNLTVLCFCAFSAIMPVSVEVNNGKIISMVGKDGQSTAQYQDTLAQYASVEKLFGTVDAAAKGNAYQLAVEYDSNYGYPQIIHIDYSEKLSDDEISFTVSNLEVLR
jgi:hypothetical protein